jgi:hypothetical protein
MSSQIEKTLKKWHHFAPYKQHQKAIKGWRNSWLHKEIIQNKKPNILQIAHAQMLDLALKQKEEFQKASEAIRFDFFDLWQDMEYSQRNAFLLQYLEPTFNTLISFEFDDEKIVIPFFDTLLNALIVKRPAVFDLPQYFKLYKEFKDNVIDAYHVYGLALLKSDFYTFTHCGSLNEIDVFYDKGHTALFTLKNGHVQNTYPLFISVEEESLLKESAQLILDQNYDAFLKFGCENQLFHPKLIKKLQKGFAKQKKGQS